MIAERQKTRTWSLDMQEGIFPVQGFGLDQFSTLGICRSSPVYPPHSRPTPTRH